MKFVRNNFISKEKKHIHLGPRSGGYFWALGHANDLPKFHVEIDVEYALLHGTVFMQNAEKDDGWKKVTHSLELVNFNEVWVDNTTHQCFEKYVLPYIPEFYIVPNDTIEGFKIRALADEFLTGTVDLYCPNCEEETLWEIDSNKKIECLVCFESVEIEFTTIQTELGQTLTTLKKEE